MNIFQMYQMMRSNPIGLIRNKFNVPNGMNTPDQIIQHLLDSGQVTQEQIDNARNMQTSFRNFMK